MQQSSKGDGGRWFRVEWAHLAVVGIVVLLIVGVVHSCHRAPTDGDHNHGRDDHVHIDPVAEDPQVAATSALTVLLSWDPVRQSGPTDGVVRTLDSFATGELLAAVDSGESVVDRPEQWGDWAMAHARVMALVPDTRVVDDRSEKGKTVLARVSQVVVYPDGGRSRLPDQQVRVHLVVEAGQWKADRVDVGSIEDGHAGDEE
ncbi:hypothetical protein [Corynebacterium bovis]|uniref:hypothetical protein n=1 Tax=Corynebacterium bovis TaxID=36808 RepID=UPI003138BA70